MKTIKIKEPDFELIYNIIEGCIFSGDNTKLERVLNLLNEVKKNGNNKKI